MPRLPKKPSILLLDDDALVLSSLEMALGEKYECLRFQTPEPAESQLRKNCPNLAILDLNLPNHDGLKILERWRRLFPELDVLICSGETDVTRAISTMRAGAADYITKPFEPSDLKFMVERILERRRVHNLAERLSPYVHPPSVNLIGRSPKLQKIRDDVLRLKHHTHINVLILGESGTGKEVIAKLVHQTEDDPKRPFVVANMPAIPATLMEAELFGVEKGAYTDAKRARAGKFEQADGGDIFLDEIGDLPIDTQAKILRTLQEKQVERVGSEKPRKVNFRVIAATNLPMDERVRQGKFRQDLMYRLNDFVIEVPPLRDRTEDIPELVEHFVSKYSTRERQVEIRDGALTQLKEYPWPGNIRELESTIKRSLVFATKGTISEFDLPKVREKAAKAGFGERMHEYERDLIKRTLLKNKGNRRAAISELGISRATFYRKVAHYGIPLNQ